MASSTSNQISVRTTLSTLINRVGMAVVTGAEDAFKEAVSGLLLEDYSFRAEIMHLISTCIGNSWPQLELIDAQTLLFAQELSSNLRSHESQIVFQKKPTTDKMALLRWLSNQLHGDFDDREDNIIALVVVLSRWLFWLPILKTADLQYREWVHDTLDEEGKLQLDTILSNVQDTMATAFMLLHVQVPSYGRALGAHTLGELPGPDMRTLARPVINSIIPANISTRCGFIESYTSEIAVQFTPDSSPLPVILDTGATLSVVDLKFLTEQFPAVPSRLPVPITLRGIGGATILHESYALLDLYIPARIDGVYTLAKITHQVLVADDLRFGPRMLLGQDVILRQGLIIDPVGGKVIISSCGDAIVPLIVRMRRIAQVEEGGTV